MPYVPTSPRTANIAVPTARSIDDYRLLSYAVTYDPTDESVTGIKVYWAEGTVDGGVFTTNMTGTHEVRGADAQAVLDVVVTRDITRLEEMETALWAMLNSEGEIPDGAS